MGFDYPVEGPQQFALDHTRPLILPDILEDLDHQRQVKLVEFDGGDAWLREALRVDEQPLHGASHQLNCPLLAVEVVELVSSPQSGIQLVALLAGRVGEGGIDVLDPVEGHWNPLIDDLADFFDVLDEQSLVEQLYVEVQNLLVLPLQQLVLPKELLVLELPSFQFVVKLVYFLLSSVGELVQQWM